MSLTDRVQVRVIWTVLCYRRPGQSLFPAQWSIPNTSTECTLINEQKLEGLFWGFNSTRFLCHLLHVRMTPFFHNSERDYNPPGSPWKSLLRSGAIYQYCRTTIVFWSQPAASEHYYTCDALIHLALRSLRMIQASHPFCFLGCLSWRTEDICIDSGSPLVHLSASVQAWAMGPKLTRSRLPPPCAVDTPKGERKGEEVEPYIDPKHKVHCWWGADSVRSAFLTCQKWNRAKILSWLTLPA